MTRGIAFESIPCLSSYSFFFFFNELEREEKGATAAAAKIGLGAKSTQLGAKGRPCGAGVFSTINDLRAKRPGIPEFSALPARSLWKKRSGRPPSLKGGVVARPFRLAGGTGGTGQHGGRVTTCADSCAHRRTHRKPEYGAATRPERMREGVRPHGGRIGSEGVMLRSLAMRRWPGLRGWKRAGRTRPGVRARSA